MGLFDKIKEAHKQRRGEKIRRASMEEARKQKILDGEIDSISLSTKLPLEPDEVP